MGEAILVTSGKGGSGKSTFAVNCGAALALMGKKVLIVDADAGLRAVDLMLSVQDRVVYDLADVLAGRCGSDRAIVGTEIPGLAVLPAPVRPNDPAFEREGMRRLCRELKGRYDFVFIDSAAGVGQGALTAAAGAEKAVILATPDPVGVRDADRIASAVIAYGTGLQSDGLRLVINRVRPDMLRGKSDIMDRVIDGAAVQLLGVIPEDPSLAAASFAGRPAVCGKKRRRCAAEAFGNIARRLSGEVVPLMKM